MTEDANISKSTNKSTNKIQRTKAASRTRAIAFIALGAAFATIGSWVTIPLGPIPFTLQMLTITLIICVYPPSWAIASIAVFILLGSFGIPLFSGFRGGLGVIMGPTGGFLLGYIPGVTIAAFMRYFLSRLTTNSVAIIAIDVFAGVAFTLIAYLTGWIQYAAVSGMSMEAAFAVSIAPFIVPDLIKVILAALCASSIRRAIPIKN